MDFLIFENQSHPIKCQTEGGGGSISMQKLWASSFKLREKSKWGKSPSLQQNKFKINSFIWLAIASRIREGEKGGDVRMEKGKESSRAGGGGGRGRWEIIA